jgi:two-component system chemotaxis sensor kinase CheA
MPSGNQALLHEFISEAREHLAAAGADLLALEKGGAEEAKPRFDRLFRAMHSIKGGAALAGCRQIGMLAHGLETVLDRLRDGRLSLDGAVTDALLAGADRVHTLLDDIDGSDEVDVAGVLARLEALAVRAPASPPLPQPATAGAPAGPPGQGVLYALRIDLAAYVRRGGTPLPQFMADLEAHGSVLETCLHVPDHDLIRGMPEGRVEYDCRIASPLSPDEITARLRLAPGELSVVPDSVPGPLGQSAIPEPTRDTGTDVPVTVPAGGEKPSTIRISVSLLDRLMALAGELVLVRNQALRAVGPDDTQMRGVVQRLNGLTTDVQQVVMLTRMQPVANLFGRFPRLVRDLSRQLGKQMQLTLDGTEVELDKSILEALADPLTHLVRNACDHGIETTASRLAAGKPAEGRILLHAHHEGGVIRIELHDDGRGIDPAVVRRAALERGLKTAAELAALTDAEAQALVLLPGFSTAERVTELSGRGVGMDVVRTNVEQLGGSLQIESTPGAGTRVHLRLPLTLAIIPCLIVADGNDRYAIPQRDLEELVCLVGEQAAARVEYAYDQQVYRLRDRLIPLVRLSEVLARPAPFTAATRAEILRKHGGDGARKIGANGNGPRTPVLGAPYAAPSTAGTREAATGDAPGVAASGSLPGLQAGPSAATTVQFAVVKAGSQRFGLVVDQLLNTEEIVVKPLHSLLKPLRCYSGATIMGDGGVALILDSEGIARHAGLTFDAARPAAAAAAPAAETQTILLFQYGPQEQFAVPLAMIRRIEEVPAARIERVGGREYVTVEGRPVRLLRLDRYLGVSPAPEQDVLYLLLPRHLKQSAGILISRVLDTENLELRLDTDGCRADGLVGTAVVRRRLTLFPDLDRLGDLLQADEGGPEPPALPRRRRRILLVEDTEFFRQLVKGYLENEGYDVVTAVNGALGLRELAGGAFDLVVSDIEMPEMDGWRLARAVREQLGRRDLPLLALTTLSSDQDRARALECGFDRYEVKIDRERFLESVSALLERAGRGEGTHG